MKKVLIACVVIVCCMFANVCIADDFTVEDINDSIVSDLYQTALEERPKLTQILQDEHMMSLLDEKYYNLFMNTDFDAPKAVYVYIPGKDFVLEDEMASSQFPIFLNDAFTYVPLYIGTSELTDYELGEWGEFVSVFTTTDNNPYDVAYVIFRYGFEDPVVISSFMKLDNGESIVRTQFSICPYFEHERKYNGIMQAIELFWNFDIDCYIMNIDG